MLRMMLLMIVGTVDQNVFLVAHDQAGYRHPVAACFDEKEEHLLIANSKSGSLSIVELDSQKVSEFKVGSSLRDVVRLGGNRFITVDYDRHQLIELELLPERKIRILHRTSVEKYPQRIACSPDNSSVFVSSLWSRRITCLGRTPAGVSSQPGNPGRRPLNPVAVIDLTFAPREMVFIPGERKLIVAGNFSGKLAVIDCRRFRVDFVHKTTGHNIRGLGLTADKKTILVSHQMLNELAHTSRNDIHWGLLMSNDLRWIKTSAFLKRDSELYKHSHMHPLGKENDAAGDPGGLGFSRDGTVVVTISGTDEIALGKETDFWLKRLKVGKRPVAVKIDANSRFAFVVNAFDDSISVINLRQQRVQHTIGLGALRPLTELELGEQLFFDASLSHDGWMSCHSCHTDGHTNGGLNDNFTDGSFGAPKKVISLLGRKETEPLAWNGLTPDFEKQVKNSIISTMKSRDPPAEETIRLLVQYVKSLSPPPALAKARNETDPLAVQQGKKVFEQLGCNECHRSPTFTTPSTYDVGLQDEFQLARFNPPSLLGVSQQSSFFHDGRAKSLTEVLNKFRHQIPENTSPEKIRQLRRFLESL